MSDPNWLLSTLAQSTAAVVAIVGGFLVSRLVQLSSEREGLRRQLAAAKNEREHVLLGAEVAGRSRLALSGEVFQNRIVGDVIEVWPNLDRDVLLNDTNIPRGSSSEEMTPFLNELVERVKAAFLEAEKYLRQDDDSRLDLDDLIRLGLKFSGSDREIYEHIAYHFHERLPEPQVSLGPMGSMPTPLLGVRMPPMTTGTSDQTMSRRLDEASREEQELTSRAVFLGVDIQRLLRELETIGRPIGVTAAVWILGVYSALGMVAPAIVMAFFPERLDAWMAWTLVALFTLGLLLVVLYIAWYARRLGRDRIGETQ